MHDETTIGNGFFQILKATALALGVSLLATVVLATIMQLSTLPDKVIYPVNQTLKVLSVALSALVFVRGERGFLKGGAIGLLFTALSYLTFSAIGGTFALSWVLLVETLLALATGVVCGAIAVNARQR